MQRWCVLSCFYKCVFLAVDTVRLWIAQGRNDFSGFRSVALEIKTTFSCRASNTRWPISLASYHYGVISFCKLRMDIGNASCSVSPHHTMPLLSWSFPITRSLLPVRPFIYVLCEGWLLLWHRIRVADPVTVHTLVASSWWTFISPQTTLSSHQRYVVDPMSIDCSQVYNLAYPREPVSASNWLDDNLSSFPHLALGIQHVNDVQLSGHHVFPEL